MNNSCYIDVEELSSIKNKKSNELKDNLSIIKTTLSNYIKSKKTQFGDKSLTHQWWDNEGNTNFKIDDNCYDEFLKVYIKELKNIGENNVLHVMEQPMEIGPLCLDFDFKQTTPERTICIDNIMHIIGIINNIVATYFGIKDKNILNSYVLMKSEPFFNKKKMVYSDGFHLQYSNLILSSVDRFLIYQESRKEIIRQDLFSDIYSVLVKVNNYKKQDNSDTQSDNEDDDLDSDSEVNNYYTLTDKEKEKINDEIFDPCVIVKNKWFLYGSGKNIEGDINIYKLAYIFDYNIDEIEDKPSQKELVKLLSIRKPDNQTNRIKPKQSGVYDELIEQVKSKYIKKTSSVGGIFDINKLFIKPQCTDNTDNTDNTYNTDNTNNSDNLNNIESNTNKKMLDYTKGTFNKTPTEQENIAYAKELVKLLSKDRACPYEVWISVGWCLYNISPTLFPEFLEFSKLAGKKFDKAGCEKVWEDCYRRNDKTGYSIPSLIKWAKEDSIVGFKELVRKKLNKSLDGRDLRTDFDVAHIVNEYYKYDFVCSGIEKKVWWEFTNNKWNRIDSAYSLSIKLSTELALEFAQLQADIIKLSVIEQGQVADILQKKSKTIQDLIFNLKKTAFKDRILKEASGLFLQKDFESKLDQNIYLVGFANGVYDLKNTIFRKGEPDDLIRKNVGYNYKEFKRDDPIIKEIEAFLESIQPEEDMRNYLCAYVASFLEGSNKDQKFMIWTGCHALNQGIMMANGTIKKVQDIKVGEQLMGDNSKPRNVLQLVRGNDTMCEIIPNKGEKFKVNLDHILSLMAADTMSYSWSEKENRYKLKWQELENGIPTCRIKNFPVKYDGKLSYKKSAIYYESKKLAEIAIGEFKKKLINSNNIIKKGDIIDISVRDYFKYSKFFGEKNYFLFKTDVKYDEQKLDIDPYLIGYLLGNGISGKNSIITAEPEIIDYFNEKIANYGLTLHYEHEYHYSITHGKLDKSSNYFSNCLKKYNIEKHIPTEFMFNSRENRLKLLAGIIDSHGHYQRDMKQYEITFKSEKLFDDVLFLVRSLGFSAYKYTGQTTCDNIGKTGIYFRMNITGINMDKIPSLLERKQCKESDKRINPNLTGFKIKILDDKEDYYGFIVDGNNRYLMDDFTVTHNCGQNGKGSLIDLIDNTFNGTDEGYFATLPPTVLTQKRGSSSAATPELATKFGKRVIILQEPEGDDKINVGFMKNITGQDKIEARPLYGDPFQYTPLFKLLLACNHLPAIPSDDGGTWRRIRVIDFMIKFTSNPQGPNERKSDSKLREKMKKWNQAFMWLLINVYYPMYVNNDGLDKLEPERVKTATDKYKADSNAIMEFFNESLEKDPESDIILNDIYDAFRVWYAGSYNDKKPLQRKKFKEYFDNNGFKVVSTHRGIVIKGVRIKEHNVEVGENNDFDD
jgi:P4 family phage/plasmid primase-like protien